MEVHPNHLGIYSKPANVGQYTHYTPDLLHGTIKELGFQISWIEKYKYVVKKNSKMNRKEFKKHAYSDKESFICNHFYIYNNYEHIKTLFSSYNDLLNS